jgi:ABC-2 type transport system ATP-binding protein
MNDRIVFDNVSKFYGEVLGVNRVNLSLAPGITSLVGPNGSGKTTLLNLLTGLIRPSRGQVRVLGLEAATDTTAFFRAVGYCTQFDSFPPNVTGFEFIEDGLLLHGLSRAQARELAEEALGRLSLLNAADRKIAGYSKGMRQKVRLAQAIAHHPSVLVLDEPLNGLDPMARAEAMALFEALARQGLHVIVSSHVLEEVDRISDAVVLMASGYVVAEGDIGQVRREVRDQPMQILVRCSHPELLASQMFCMNHVVEARLHQDGGGLLLRTRDMDQFYMILNRLASEGLVEVESVAPADQDVHSIYQYLIGESGGTPTA